MRAARTSRLMLRRSPSRAATSACSAAVRRPSTRPRPSWPRSSRASRPWAAIRTLSTSSRIPATRAPRRSCRPRASSTCSSRAAGPGSSVPACRMPPFPASRPAPASAMSTWTNMLTLIRPCASLKTPRPAAPRSAMPRRSALCIGRSRLSFCPCSRRCWSTTARRRASRRSSCGSMRQRRRSSTAHPHPTRTLTRSIWTISSPSAWSTVWTPLSRTCLHTRRTIAMPS